MVHLFLKIEKKYFALLDSESQWSFFILKSVIPYEAIFNHINFLNPIYSLFFTMCGGALGSFKKSRQKRTYN